MLSPAIITLPWRPDAAEHYFAPLSALPWAMLLHSGFADHPHNRFDILVAAPRATLLTRGEQTWVDDGETVVVSAEDPLQLLQQQFQPDKLNVAALGNMVPQLHVHLIARFIGDAAWPAPVWGKVPAQPYSDAAAEALLGDLRGALALA